MTKFRPGSIIFFLLTHFTIFKHFHCFAFRGNQAGYSVAIRVIMCDVCPRFSGRNF